MSRATLARRYGPLLAVAAVQLLIIAVVPSTAQKDAQQVGAQGPTGSTTFSTLPGGGVVDPETGLVYDPTTGQVIGSTDGTTVTSGGGTRTSTTGGGGGGGTGGGTGGGGGSGGGGGGGGGGDGGGGTTGDTKHCVGGRQYDPTIYEWAPPCVPKFIGDNGGTPRGTRGVTGNKITVVALLGNYGSAVQAILERQGSPSITQFSNFAEAAEKFLNAHYEFYGRKIDIVPYMFKAVTGGEKAPDEAELRNEARQIVQTYNPFAVTWSNSVSSATYDEFSRLKVVNLGGYGFTDDFNAARRPYHWDVQMGGFQLADAVSSWWCTRMHGGGTAKAAYAKSTTAYPLQNQVRELGVITTNDPENLETVSRVKALLKSKCGVEVTRQYEYAQDIRTLQEQRLNAYNRMTTGTGPDATSIMCFCDQVAPTFLYKTCTDFDYYPEHILVGTGHMDLDRAAQAYDHGAEYPQKTNNGQRADDGLYEQFENAFGLAQFPKQAAVGQSWAAKVWRFAGNTGNPQYTATNEELHYYAMLAGMIQMAGRQLTPFTLETGATKLGALGSLTSELSSQRSLGPGDYTWNDSLREVYWAPATPSAFNGTKGSYSSLNGGRSFIKGQFPAGLLTLPPKPRP